VVQQLTEGNLPFGSHGRRRVARRIMASDHHRVRQFREHALDGRVERDLTLIDKLEGGDLGWIGVQVRTFKM
jgi:hypothetical protein